MERQFVSVGGASTSRLVNESIPRHAAYTQYYKRRAHAFAESVARTTLTLEDTLLVADQLLISGLAAASRGELTAGGHQLTKSLIASALAAWQVIQLSAEDCIDQNHFVALSGRSAAELQLRWIPVRARLAATALRATPEGEALLTELHATLSAFVLGYCVGRAVFNEPQLLDWQRSFTAAIDGTRDEIASCHVAGLGLPRTTTSSSSGDARRAMDRESRPGLSVREREVLGQIVGGLTTAQIALRLGVKTTTVATLVGRIFNKLGVNNRAAAVGIALSYGLCPAFEEEHAQKT